MLDVEKLIIDVFNPEPGETVTVVVDLPHGTFAETPEWAQRRAMAERWRQAAQRLGAERGFTVAPLLSFPATGANNADLPNDGTSGDQPVVLEQALTSSTLVIAMTTFSATAPLANLCERHADLRAASMPGVVPRMEQTALAADYARVARRCQAIAAEMKQAELLDVVFSTGHRCWFDLRHRQPEVDDGSLPRGKQGDRVINLPSGETFEVPYEGEREDVPSQTAGTIPMIEDGEPMLLQVAANRIQAVTGSGSQAQRFREFLATDPARTNIAEVAFGVNEKAEVWGNLLEDEKAGFHWAYGRSEHLGGVTSPARFSSPAHVVHTDVVYARGNPIQVVSATLVGLEGEITPIISDGAYLPAYA